MPVNPADYYWWCRVENESGFKNATGEGATHEEAGQAAQSAYRERYRANPKWERYENRPRGER
jgi:hypothetical protein